MSSQTKAEVESELIRVCTEELKEEKDGFLKLKELLKTPGISVEVTDKDGMTPLMHAAYCGHYEACQLLLEKGADVNSDLHSEGYTALMFSTVAGHSRVVDLLLRSRAKIDVVNKIGKTAAQLGGFVGQHETVQVINNFFSISELEYYTRPQGFEKSPKLDPPLLNPLHAYISTINLNPIGLLLQVHSGDIHLLDHTQMICKVLDLMCEKAIKNEKEPFSLKLHYLSYSLKEFSKYDEKEPLLKSFLMFSDEGLALEVERFLRQSLKCYPHTYSVLLKQMVATLSKIPLGGSPSTLSIFSSYLIGNRMFDEETYCSTCGVCSGDLKKCSKCTQVFYCSVDCQRLAWTVGNHKRLCKKWSKNLPTADKEAAALNTSTETEP